MLADKDLLTIKSTTIFTNTAHDNFVTKKNDNIINLHLCLSST